MGGGEQHRRYRHQASALASGISIEHRYLHSLLCISVKDVEGMNISISQSKALIRAILCHVCFKLSSFAMTISDCHSLTHSLNTGDE